jgi:hypothetical protein
MLKTVIVYLISTAVVAGAFPNSGTVTITFDDLAGNAKGVVKVPNGYEGLRWYHFAYLDVADLGSSNTLQDALVSPKNVAINHPGLPAWVGSRGQAFDLDSAFLTAEGKDQVLVRVEGFLGSALKYDNTFTLDRSNPTLIEFNYLDVTRVRFIPFDSGLRLGSSSSSGNAVISLPQTRGYLAMDDMTVTFMNTVPEPGPGQLLIVGSALAGFDCLHRQFRQARIHRRRPRFESTSDVPAEV